VNIKGVMCALYPENPNNSFHWAFSKATSRDTCIRKFVILKSAVRSKPQNTQKIFLVAVLVLNPANFSAIIVEGFCAFPIQEFP
jgi:hypothetical protein